MTVTRLLLAPLLVCLALAGCAPVAGPSATPTPSETPTATPTPVVEEPTASALVIALDRITVEDQNGSELESAPLDDPDAALALVSALMGSTPEPVDNHQFGTWYEWPEIRVNVNFSASSVQVTSPTVAGLPAHTSQSIHVGSSRADVIALDPIPGFDFEGDGVPDSYGLEPVTVPDIESLTNPGQPGTAYIGIVMTGDSVTRIVTPSGDYLDI